MPVALSDAAAAPDGPGPAGQGVSVVIPVRNEADALPEALRSVAAQDHVGPVEVIVADGSDGPATAMAARRTLPGVRIVPNPGRLAAAGMNVGVAAASHPIVVRCDARCVLPPDYVRRAVTALAVSGAVNAGGRLLPRGRTPFEHAAAMAMASFLGSGGPRYRRRRGAYGPTDTVPLGVFRRDGLAAVGGFDATLARNEDYEVNWRLRRAGGTVLFDPALAVIYRPRAALGPLARQYYDYGWWKRVVLARHPGSWRARHLAAPALVLGLAASAAAAGVGALLSSAEPAAARWLLAAASVVPATWCGALALGGLAAVARSRAAVAWAVPVLVGVMQVAWGAGFLAAARAARSGAR